MTGLSAVACTGCRIRRKKCDRAQPICSGCKGLNVPIELCLYPDQSKKSYYGKNPRNVLEQLKLQNKKLYKNQLHLKHIFEDGYTKSITRSELVNLPVLNKHPADFIRRELISNSKWGHCGSLSWPSLLVGESSIGMINVKFNEIINHEKSKYNKVEAELTNEALSDHKLNKIRRTVISMSLGIDPISIDVLYDLLDSVVEYLPDYNMARLLFAKYFQLNKYRGIQVDEEEAILDFHRLFSIGEDGSLALKMIPPKKIVDYVGKLSLILVIITYPIIFQHYKLPQKKNKNYLLLLAYAEIMIHSTSSFQKQGITKSVNTLPTLIATSQIRFFEHYCPNGKTDGEDGFSSSLSLKEQISIFKTFGLDNNVDVNFPNTSIAHRNSLKSLYYHFIIHDLWESFELGLPPKFKSDEIIKYEDFGDSKILESIMILSRVLERFHKYESLLTVQNTCNMIENDFIYELQAIIYVEFDSLNKYVEDLQNLDLKKTSSGELMQMTHRLGMMLFIYSVIMSMYNICYRKSIQFQPNDIEMINKYKILSVKYGFLCLFAQIEILKGFQRIFKSSNAERLLPLEPLLRLSAYMRLSMRRLGIIIGARIYDYAPYDNETILQMISSNIEYFNTPKIDERTVLNMVPKFFTIKELQDCEIDRDNVKLMEKFSTKMLDYKVLLLNAFKAMTDMKYAIVNDKYNIKFIKNNFTYYQIIKLMSFMINTVYSNETSNEIGAIGALQTPPTTANESAIFSNKPSSDTESADQFFIDDTTFQQILDTNFEKFNYNDFFYDTLITTDSNNTTGMEFPVNSSFPEFDNFFDTFASKVVEDGG